MPIAVHPPQDEEDDFFSTTAVQGSSSDPLVHQEYTRIATKYSDAGYREGITDGKLSTLQHGFDAAFAQSVPLSRRVGALRGRAAALLALVTSFPGASGQSTATDDIHDLIRDLGHVRRAQILPPDLERIQHEQDEHAGEHGHDAYELDPNDHRDMEGLDSALEGLGGDQAQAQAHGVEGVEKLEARLKVLEEKVRG